MKTKAIISQANTLAIPMSSDSVHAVITSPPYLNLRDYGTGADNGELGQETLADCRTYKPGPSAMTEAVLRDVKAALSVEGVSERQRLFIIENMMETWRDRIGRLRQPCGRCHVCNLVKALREVKRVLHPSGTLWLVYGDMYAKKDQGGTSPIKKGDRLLMNARIALALQADGWWLRHPVIWHKTNAMPGPAQIYRRPVGSYESVYMLAKSYDDYYYDAWAVKQSFSPHRHKRDVWNIPTQGWDGEHFAVFPEALVEPIVKAATSEHGVCSNCGNPWKRIIERGEVPEHTRGEQSWTDGSGTMNRDNPGGGLGNLVPEQKMVGWEPTCDCGAETVPATVLDNFVGSGTTVKVARDLGRIGVGLDISHEYLREEAGRRLVTYNGVKPTLERLREIDNGNGSRNGRYKEDLAGLPLFN